MTLAFILTLFSCDRIKRKGDAVVDKTKQAASETKQKISNKADNLVDKVFPTYDKGKADTENNKNRFKEHLQVDLTSDVKNIYAYGDFLGADYKVLIAFYSQPSLCTSKAMCQTALCVGFAALAVSKFILR